MSELDHSGSCDECLVCCPDFPTNISPIPMHVPPPKMHCHHCPECYEVYECGWNCTIEPDLEDPVCYPGKEFGAHCTCFSCQKKEHGKTAVYSQEWWDNYHGITRK